MLNLNEKDQTLNSLLRYRIYWKDQFLVWDPDDYDGIKNSKRFSIVLNKLNYKGSYENMF